jgi:hypothetical protein
MMSESNCKDEADCEKSKGGVAHLGFTLFQECFLRRKEDGGEVVQRGRVGFSGTGQRVLCRRLLVRHGLFRGDNIGCEQEVCQDG